MASVNVILKKDVVGVGEEGDVKNVKSGFARNYLYPKGLAVPKTKVNMLILEREKEAIEARKEEKRKASQSLLEQLKDIKVVIKATAAENDKLYGSITNSNVAEALAEQGFEIDKRKIEIDHAIKVLGEFDARIKLYEGIYAPIKIIVEKE